MKAFEVGATTFDTTTAETVDIPESLKEESEPTPEPKAPKPKAPEAVKSKKCELKAKGTFLNGIARLKVDKNSTISCNKAQEITLEQNGRFFTYVRTIIGTVSKPKKED